MRRNRPQSKRVNRVGVVAGLQLLWVSAEPNTIELVKPHLDPALYRQQYPARSLFDNGEGVLDTSQRMPREAMLMHIGEIRRVR